MTKEHAKVREPIVRMAKRTNISFVRAWIIRLCAIALSLVVCSALIYALTKLNPIKVFGAMVEGAFGTKKRMWSMFKDTAFLLIVGVALAPAFKMKFWNIGAEGQILVGGITTAAFMIYFADTFPAYVLFPLMVIASCVAGALWGMIPAIFKSKWNTNETLFTLMMNYVAVQLTSYCVALWENPYGSNSVGIINPKTRIGWFPALFGQTYALNIIIAAALTIGMFVYLRYTKHGYEISVVGESENTAKYAGINVPKVFIRTMLISGAICGLAGFVAVSGASHTISTNTAGGNGFTAIIVAWLAKFNPIGMAVISALLVFLDKGAVQIASQFGLNDYVSEMITGLILFFILGCEFFINYKLIFRSKKEAE